MDNVIEIHPYDLYEILDRKIKDQSLTDAYVTLSETKSLGNGLFEIDGKFYHQSALAPRTEGQHFIF